MIKVSVVVPVYNTKQYLERCIDSLINQTLTELEIILVNDCSPDDSILVLKSYESRYPDRIKVIDSPENKKIGGARNLGAAIARGEYIGFVDSDDWVELNMFELMYNHAISGGYEVVDADYAIVNDNGQRTVRSSSESINKDMLMPEDNKALIMNSGYVPTKIFKRSFYLENHLAFPEKVFFEDLPFLFVALACAKSYGKIEKPLYNYYDRENSTTTVRNSIKLLDRMITAKLFIEDFKTRNIFENYENEIEFQFIKVYYLRTLMIMTRQFDRYDYSKLYEIRNYVRSNYKKYKSNPYYKRLNRTNRLLASMNDVSPYLFAFASKIIRTLRAGKI